MKIAILIKDVETVKALIYAYALQRCAYLQMPDIWLSHKPTMGILYRVRCHVDDVTMIREQANAMYTAGAPSTDERREAIIKRVPEIFKL